VSAPREAAWGVACNWTGKICAIVITFFVTPVLIHGLGNEAYGIWVMVMSLGPYYALGNLGLRAASVKYISQFEAIGDRGSVNTVIVTTLAAFVPLAGIVALLVAGIAYVFLRFPNLIETQQVAPSIVWQVIVITGLGIVVGIIGQAFMAILVAFRRFDQINLLSIVMQLVQGGLIIASIRMGGGLIAIAWIVVGVTLTSELCMLSLAVRVVGPIRLSRRLFDWSTLKTLLGFGSRSLFHGIARRSTTYGGTFIVGVVLGPATVAFYVVAQALALKTEDVGQGLTSVLMPIISQLDAQKRRRELAEAFFVASRVLMALAISIAAAFVLVGRPLIELWIGKEFGAVSYPVLCLLGSGMAIRMGSLASASVLKGTGRMDRLVVAAIAEAALTLTLGIALVTSIGLVGMGWAVLLTQVVVAGMLLPWLTCRATEIPLTAFAKRAFIPGLTAAIPGIVVGLALSSLFPASHLAHVVLHALGIVAATGIAMYFVCFDEQLRGRLLPRSLFSKRFA
jgi:O-antigen/teichoic acid export membrane protein